MARPLRIEYDGAVYHVTSRGNARKPIFIDNKDREFFLGTLAQVNKRYHWICHAYCLMNNHYHLVIETPDGNLSKGMRQLNGVYTQAFNRRHNRVGHIFQGRYKAILIQKERHLLEVSRYVVLNPVRAKAVERPEQWKWSSYRGTAGKEEPHSCMTPDWILGQFHKRRGRAEERYREFVRAGIGQKGLWDKVKGQIILGEEGFIREMTDYVERSRDVREIPRRQRFAARPGLDTLFRWDSGGGKGRVPRRVREAVERYGYNQREVAKFLGVHYSSVSRMLRKGND